MSNNLVADQKTNWVDSDTVRPIHMNNIGEGINNLANLMPVYASNGSFYENTSYSSNTYVLAPVTFSDDSQNVAPTSYFNGMEVVFKSSTSNTGDCYVNVNGLGAKQIKTLKNQALTAGSIPQGWLVTLRYDSTQDCFYILENKGAVGRNIGDLFYTYRKDTSLNGAYEANGQEFNKADFTGDTNPYDLIVANSLPNGTYEEFDAEVAEKGYCNFWGIDTTNQKFKVPKLNTIKIPAGKIPVIGSGLTIGLTDGTHNIGSGWSETVGVTGLENYYGNNIGIFAAGSFSVPNGYSIGLTTDASKSGIVANTQQGETIELRPMVQLATGADETSLTNTTQCLAELPKKANIIWYANREFEYKKPDFIFADKQYVTIKGGTAIRKANGDTFYTENDLLKPISEILDTGSVENGKDYYFYLDNQGNLIASLNEQLPTGITNAVQIGGAHTLCVGVTESNAPDLPADSFWMNHPAKGYNAGYFIPNSSWTPAFRSAAKTGNKGMAFVDRNDVRVWVDIYLLSGTGSASASSYAGTISSNRQYPNFFWDLKQVGKMPASRDEFMTFAEGSNQKTSIQGSNIPTDKKCGGYLDTAGKRMISGYFIECCCGYLWQVSRQIAATGSQNWNAFADARRGGTYGVPYVVLLGGRYGDSSNCGSWSVYSYHNLLNSLVGTGCRGVSLHLERVHA